MMSVGQRGFVTAGGTQRSEPNTLCRPRLRRSGSTLARTNVTLADAGDYSITVSNAAGPVPSQTAILRVVVPPTLTPPVIAAGAMAFAFLQEPGPTCSVLREKAAGVRVTGGMADVFLASLGPIVGSEIGPPPANRSAIGTPPRPPARLWRLLRGNSTWHNACNTTLELMFRLLKIDSKSLALAASMAAALTTAAPAPTDTSAGLGTIGANALECSGSLASPNGRPVAPSAPMKFFRANSTP